MTDIEVFFSSVLHRMDEVLEELIPKAETEPRRLHEAVRWSIFGGGKRFRPAIVLASGSIFGAPEDQMLHTAAAIEMVHTYSLIHDDLPAMDDDDMRRGRETCHKKYGEAAAILAGDLLLTLAFGAVANDGRLEADRRLRLVSLISNAAGSPDGMVAGQQMDLDAEGSDLALDAVEAIHRRKTGALITAAAEAGAAIGGASGPQTALVREIGSKLGLLYQITDDVLDVTQTSKSLGKTAGKDARSGKATYPKYLGIDGSREKASELQREITALAGELDEKASLIVDISEFVLNRTR